MRLLRPSSPSTWRSWLPPNHRPAQSFRRPASRQQMAMLTLKPGAQSLQSFNWTQILWNATLLCSASSSSSPDGYQLLHWGSLHSFDQWTPHFEGRRGCNRNVTKWHTYCRCWVMDNMRRVDGCEFYQSAESRWGGWFPSPTCLTNWLVHWFPDLLFLCLHVSVCVGRN